MGGRSSTARPDDPDHGSGPPPPIVSPAGGTITATARVSLEDLSIECVEPGNEPLENAPPTPLGILREHTFTSAIDGAVARSCVVFAPLDPVVPWSSSEASGSHDADPDPPSVVLLFPGTNEVAFLARMAGEEDERQGNLTQLFRQKDGDKAWLRVAHQFNLVLVFCQSLPEDGITPGGKVPYGWRPGDEDISYVRSIVEWAQSADWQYPQPPNPNSYILPRLFAAGFSNGGLFISDVAVKIGGRSFEKLCNYQGGLATIPGWADDDLREALKDELLDLSTAGPKCPLLIITSGRDENYRPCVKANEAFTEHEWDVTYVVIPGRRHAFASDSPEEIARWFRGRDGDHEVHAVAIAEETARQDEARAAAATAAVGEGSDTGSA